MVGLVRTFQPTQDGDGVSHRRLADIDLLEPTFEGRVLLDVLAELVQRGGADHPQLTAGEHGLEHVSGVHRALAATGFHHGVQLVDERDHLALGLLDLIQDGLEALLELPAVLAPGDHGAQVERDQPPVAQ